MDEESFYLLAVRTFDNAMSYDLKTNDKTIEIAKAACCEYVLTKEPDYTNVDFLSYCFKYFADDSCKWSLNWAYNNKLGEYRVVNISATDGIVISIAYESILNTEIFRAYIEELNRQNLINFNKKSKKIRHIDNESLRYKKQQNQLRSKFFK